MKKCFLAAALLAACGMSVANAEGLPSQSKLSNLGLSSMDVVSDTDGLAVRGKFLSTGGIGNLLTAGAVTTPFGGIGTFPVTAVQMYIGGNSPRALGASAFGATGFGTVGVATLNGNPTFSSFVGVPATASVADISGSGQLSVQFWATSIGN